MHAITANINFAEWFTREKVRETKKREKTGRFDITISGRFDIFFFCHSRRVTHFLKAGIVKKGGMRPPMKLVRNIYIYKKLYSPFNG